MQYIFACYIYNPLHTFCNANRKHEKMRVAYYMQSCYTFSITVRLKKTAAFLSLTFVVTDNYY